MYELKRHFDALLEQPPLFCIRKAVSFAATYMLFRNQMFASWIKKRGMQFLSSSLSRGKNRLLCCTSIGGIVFSVLETANICVMGKLPGTLTSSSLKSTQTFLLLCLWSFSSPMASGVLLPMLTGRVELYILPHWMGEVSCQGIPSMALKLKGHFLVKASYFCLWNKTEPFSRIL